MTQMSRRIIVGALGAAAWVGSGTWAAAQDVNPLIEERRLSADEIAQCQRDLSIDPKAHRPMLPVHLPPGQTCRTDLRKNGFPVPDPACTPGAINPTLTVDVLKDASFKTGCVRDQATAEAHSAQPEERPGPAKTDTYEWYGVSRPEDNQGRKQTCELDHLISLELGGADTLDNIWPQCGPPGVALDERFFKEKDTVENFLAWMVKGGKMDLVDAQKGIASDWTQFLDEAQAKCPGGNCPRTPPQ